MFHFYLTTSTPTPITNYIAFFLIIKQLISFPVDAFLTEILPLAPVDSNTLARHLSEYINITFPVVLFAWAYFIYDFFTQDISHGQETLVENSKWDNLSRGGRDTLGQIRGEDLWDTSLGHLADNERGRKLHCPQRAPTVVTFPIVVFCALDYTRNLQFSLHLHLQFGQQQVLAMSKWIGPVIFSFHFMSYH